MVDKNSPSEKLSPWWRRSVIIVLVIGFAVLIWMAIRAHQDAPPIPERVVGPSGETIFTRDEIIAGQEVFLKYGLMENGTIWGHGAYLGPDFSAEYLHTLSIDARDHLAKQHYQREWSNLSS
ncbi:MAG: nitric-oxide reductase large subunit, partial [Desulfobacterales bacterium]|nr:nitric-oxide reductase large subunit [Desulfobacterales bacterium]